MRDLIEKDRLHKYAMTAEIVSILGGDEEVDTAIFKVGTYNLRCFLPDYRIEKWKEKKANEEKYLGQKVKIILFLLYLEKPEKNTMKKRRIEQVATKYIPAEYSTWYEVEGTVKEVHDEFWVIDCGITIIVDRATSENYRVGDWIVARGRLDAYLIDVL